MVTSDGVKVDSASLSIWNLFGFHGCEEDVRGLVCSNRGGAEENGKATAGFCGKYPLLC
jgi:hypothetical protein